MESNSIHNHLLSSLISDIKSYSGNDPLLPWLRGIKKMKESLPSNLLKEKMPRFLQKCTQTFYSGRRYRNDLRYLRVWLHLMDYVDEPKALLRTMEMNHIGKKRALFYQAYALYYEKMKTFDEAEKMYHLGVKNLVEPVDELQKSDEQFLHRMERYRNKKIQRQERRPTFTAKNKDGVGNSVASTSFHDQQFTEVPRTAHEISKDSWIQVCFVLTTGINSAYVLGYSDAVMVHLGWIAGVVGLIAATALSLYASTLVAKIHEVGGRRHIRYRDLAGYIYGKKGFYTAWILQYLNLFMFNIRFIILGGSAIKGK